MSRPTTVLVASLLLAHVLGAAECAAQEDRTDDRSGHAGATKDGSKKPTKDDSPLLLEIVPIATRLRTHAPMPVDVKLLWRGKELLDGRLEAEFQPDSSGGGARPLFRWSTELSLTPGLRTTRVWLPTAMTPHQGISLQARCRFVTRKGTVLALKDQEFRVPSAGRLDGLVAVIHPDGRPDDGGDARTLGLLHLDSHAPDRPTPSPLVTTVHHMPLSQAPSRGLQYLAFDVVVVTPGALAELRPKQVDALVQWAEGGGSVLAMLDRPVNANSAAVLSRLAGGPDRVRPEPVDAPATKGLWKFHPGVGRFALLRGPLDPKIFASEDTWRDASLFLWKVCRDMARQVSDGGGLRLVTPAGVSVNWTDSQVNYRVVPYDQRNYRTTAEIGESDLVALLMPDTIASVSLPTVAGVLVLFLFAIGPADWFVLGWLRRRPLTWIVFPLTSLAFLAVMMHQARSRLGSADHRRSLIVADLADDGRVTRHSRFELLFTGVEKEMEIDGSAAFVTPFRTGSASADPYGQWGGQPGPYGYSNTPEASRENQPSHWIGIPPSARVVRPMRQWTPRLHRVTSLEGGDLKPPEFLKTVSFDEAKDGAGHRRIFERGRAEIPAATILVLRGWTYHLIGDGGQTLSGDANYRGQRPSALLETIESLTGAPQTQAGGGLFSIVSQRSPDGADRLDDLVLVDPTDDRQAVVVVVVRRGDDVVVFRKVVRAPEGDR